jgi:hypothetical protein
VDTLPEPLNPRAGVAGPPKAMPEQAGRSSLQELAADVTIENGIPFCIGQHKLVLCQGRGFGVLQLFVRDRFAVGLTGSFS